MTTFEKEYRTHVLDDATCRSLANKVYAMRHVARVGNEGFFYTLGTALYQNDDNQVYFQKAALSNKLLFEEFTPLYELILDTVAAFLGQGCGFLHEFALPGFHLFEIGNVGRYEGGGAHCDLSYEKIFKGYIPPLPHYSFTLPLQLPAAPAGLDMWPLHYREMLQMPPGFDAIAESRNRTSRFIPYHAGEMVIFDGHYFHRIAGTTTISSTDRRITLQGHCLFLNGYWTIYF